MPVEVRFAYQKKVSYEFRKFKGFRKMEKKEPDLWIGDSGSPRMTQQKKNNFIAQTKISPQSFTKQTLKNLKQRLKALEKTVVGFPWDLDLMHFDATKKNGKE